jgi:hypothetical protein
MAAQQNILGFAHIALLWNLAEGPQKATYFCPDGNKLILPIIMRAATELLGMGLLSIAGESSSTVEFRLTDQGEKMALRLSLETELQGSHTGPAELWS